ncbi:hypothetical protein BGX23_003233 [Mortierella sp. AD031]|nr:hypothetical protein BGX23_003233 [Mortierella sp. AD031]
MEPPSSDYMSIQDLSRPRRTPLQTQLEKIDASIIRNGTPTSRNNRRGPGRPKIDTETAVFEVSVLAFREIVLNRLWKNDKRFQSENDFCKHQWDIPKPRKTLLIECAEVLMVRVVADAGSSLLRASLQGTESSFSTTATICASEDIHYSGTLAASSQCMEDAIQDTASGTD